MADITVTAAKVGACFPAKAEIYDFIANATITVGQAVYLLSTGKVGVADANAAGLQQFRGIALTGGGAGQAISVLKEGHCAGFTLAGDADSLVYLSNTPGAVADATAGGGGDAKSVLVGRVVCLTDADLTKVLYVHADWLRAWA